MKKLLISALAAGLMLSACASNNKSEAEPQRPQISVEEAMQQCKQASGETQDRAVFDACMKDKGFLRSAPQAAPADASAPVPAPVKK